jgi:hypothetical protein
MLKRPSWLGQPKRDLRDLKVTEVWAASGQATTTLSHWKVRKSWRHISMNLRRDPEYEFPWIRVLISHSELSQKYLCSDITYGVLDFSPPPPLSMLRSIFTSGTIFKQINSSLVSNPWRSNQPFCHHSFHSLKWIKPPSVISQHSILCPRKVSVHVTLPMGTFPPKDI